MAMLVAACVLFMVGAQTAAGQGAPPKSIADILAILEQEKPDPAKISKLRDEADREPSSRASPSDLLTFYLRRRIGTRRWRNLHRLTPLVYVLGVIHALGSGSDAGTTWMTLLLLATGTPILYLGILRALPATPVAAPDPSR